jgi:hypothetical protein
LFFFLGRAELRRDCLVFFSFFLKGFPSFSQMVPQVLKLFPNTFPITPQLYMTIRTHEHGKMKEKHERLLKYHHLCQFTIVVGHERKHAKVYRVK